MYLKIYKTKIPTKILENPHLFSKEAKKYNITYEILMDSKESIGTQSLSRMFHGKSKRNGTGHMSAVMIEGWILTLEFSKNNPDILDPVNKCTQRSIEPCDSWYEYIKLLYEPLDEEICNNIIEMTLVSRQKLAESLGINKGIKNSKAVKNLTERLIKTIEFRKKHFWNKPYPKDTIEKNSEDEKPNYKLNNIFELREKCTELGLTNQGTKSEMIDRIESHVVEVVDEVKPSYEEMNKQDLINICKDRGFVYYANLTKNKLVELLEKNDNNEVILFDSENSVLVENTEADSLKLITKIQEYTLTLNSGDKLEIPIRQDGYINATKLCKAGKKKFHDWIRLNTTKELIDSLSLTVGIPAVRLIESSEGRYGGSWIHPDLAIHLAQWLSPSFAVQVSLWIKELLVKERVDLDKSVRCLTDMSELDAEAKELESDYDWSKNSNSLCVYVAYVGNGYIKVGGSDCGLAERIAKHTSSESKYNQFRILDTFEVSSLKMEIELHDSLYQYRQTYHKQKEIYKYSGNLNKFVKMVSIILKDSDHKLRVDRLEKENLNLKVRLMELEKRLSV